MSTWTGNVSGRYQRPVWEYELRQTVSASSQSRNANHRADFRRENLEGVSTTRSDSLRFLIPACCCLWRMSAFLMSYEGRWLEGALETRRSAFFCWRWFCPSADNGYKELCWFALGASPRGSWLSKGVFCCFWPGMDAFRCERGVYGTGYAWWAVWPELVTNAWACIPGRCGYPASHESESCALVRLLRELGVCGVFITGLFGLWTPFRSMRLQMARLMGADGVCAGVECPCFSYYILLAVRGAVGTGRRRLSAVARSEFIIIFLISFWDAAERGARRAKVPVSGLKMHWGVPTGVSLHPFFLISL